MMFQWLHKGSFCLLCCAVSLGAECASEFVVYQPVEQPCCKKKKVSKRRELEQLRSEVVDQALECMEILNSHTKRLAAKSSGDKRNGEIIVSFCNIVQELLRLSRELVDNEGNSFVAKADAQTLRELLATLKEINSVADKDITVIWVQAQEKKIKKICCSDILKSK